MPEFTIETTYHLPVFRHRTYAVETLDAACRAAIGDDNWDIAERDFGSSGATHVTGIWHGTRAAHSGPSMSIPAQFDEPVQRKARHFEILLGLLKMLVSNIRLGNVTSDGWLNKADMEIARGAAIIAGMADPGEPAEPPRYAHVLAKLYEDRVHRLASTILAFEGGELTPAHVLDSDIRIACGMVARTMNFAAETGKAEFRAALMAIYEARRRHDT